MWKSSKRLKKVLLAVLFSVLLLTYGATYRYFISFSTQKITVPQHIGNGSGIITHQSLPLRTSNGNSSARYYCNYPFDFNASSFEEGQGYPGWKLKQVHVIIRHGDRTSIKHFRHASFASKPTYCSIFKDPIVEQYEIFKKFRTFISSKQSSRNLSSFAPIARYCSSAQLTTIGVLQHLLNGAAYREKYYRQLQLFHSDAVKKISIMSTSYARTVHSAFAFAFGFFPEFTKSKITVSRVENVLFCTKDCFCPSGKYREKIINTRKKQLYTERFQYNKTLQKMASIADVPDRPGPQLDSLVTGLHCKSLKLPCDSTGRCITEENLDVILDEQEVLVKVLKAETPLLKQSLLRVQPLLKSISLSMENAIADSQNSQKFFLYSGHDITVRPLLYAFQIPENRWPRLASRFVFELWESEGRHYIRLIYNGKDVTSFASFCMGVSKCFFDEFTKFATLDILAYFHAKTRREACTIYQ